MWSSNSKAFKSSKQDSSWCPENTTPIIKQPLPVKTTFSFLRVTSFQFFYFLVLLNIVKLLNVKLLFLLYAVNKKRCETM